jgi:hypothetical protein
MNDGRYWYKYTFSQSELEKYQDFYEQKQLEIGPKYGAFDNLEGRGKRWVGVLGEVGFQKMLDDRYGLVDGLDYIRSASEKKIDDSDFSLKGSQKIEIDVKTIAGRVIPHPNYFANVNVDQYLKRGPVNVFAFAQFVIPSSTVYLIGWCTKSEFKNKGKFLKKGEKSNTIVVNAAMYCLPYNQLRPFSNQRKSPP